MKRRSFAEATKDMVGIDILKPAQEYLPKPNRSGKIPEARPFDFRRLKVLDRRDHGDVSLITVGLSASDVILAGVAVNDTLTMHAMSPGAAIARPIIEWNGEPALVLRVQNPPESLAVNRLVNVSAVFGIDATFGEPAISAVVTKLKVRSDREPGAGAPITLPITGRRPPITDEDVGLVPNPRSQARAEAFILAAIGYRLHVEQKARDAARLAAAARIAPGPTVAVEVPDDAMVLISPTDTLDETDRGIYRELVRLTARPPRGARKRPAA